MRLAAVAALVLAALVRPARRSASAGESRNAYAVSNARRGSARARAQTPIHALVNAWGIAASPTGPWWTANEARGSSTLYSGSGRKQLLTVTVDGGPTGVAYYGGKRLPRLGRRRLRPGAVHLRV